MDMRTQPVAFNIGKAWSEIYSEVPCEFYDDHGNFIGIKYAVFVSKTLCIVDGVEYKMYPKLKKDGSYELDRRRKVVIFLVKSMFFRESNMWP